jgi:hypothetical protein
MHRPFLVLAAAALAWAWLGACAAEGEPSNDSGAGGGTAATTGSSTSTIASTGDGLVTSSSSGGSGGFGGGCAGVASKVEPTPLDIFVMLDQSGSMLQDAGNLLSRWQTVKQALTTFVQEPSTDGIGIGIQYFGLPQPLVPGCYAISCATDADCSGCGLCHPAGVCQAPYNPDIDSCDAFDYAWADVPIQALPAGANPIIASLAMHSPGTNTPTLPALQGAIDYAKAWQAAHPDHVTVVALATDGDPSECDIDLDNLNAVAAAGYAGSPSVPTFVIGVGPSLALLDDIAAAGGTVAAFHVDFDVMAQEQFLEAMNTIRSAALPCAYPIPPPPAGQVEDFALVNVTYIPGDGGPEQTIPGVGAAAQCPVNGDGWYYDDIAAPTQIILCAATCAEIADDTMAEVDIVFGCQTIVR